MKCAQMIGDGLRAGWRWPLIAAGLMLAMGLSAPAQAQSRAPVDCDGVRLELDARFVSPICYRSRFPRGIGRSESIHGETRDHLMLLESDRAGSGNTYVYGIDLQEMLGWYGLKERHQVLSGEREAGDGFRYISVGGNGLDSCILFLKQLRPIRKGYRARYYGLACDKNRTGAYEPEDAMALIDLIKDY